MSGTGPTVSAGLLLFRRRSGLEVLIAHMGGPFWAGRDERGWTIPKGIPEPGESDLAAVAEREFAEEIGTAAPPGPTIDLGAAAAGRKRNHIFAREADLEIDTVRSNTFELEWPRGSGVVRTFPEVDDAAWVDVTTARTKLTKGLVVFLDRLEAALA